MTEESRFPGRNKIFFCSPKHPSWLPGSFILWGKVATAWTRPLTSTAAVKSVEPCFHSPVRLHVMHKDNFIFTSAAVNIRIYCLRFAISCSLLNGHWNWRHPVFLKVGTYLANWTTAHLRDCNLIYIWHNLKSEWSLPVYRIVFSSVIIKWET